MTNGRKIVQALRKAGQLARKEFTAPQGASPAVLRHAAVRWSG